MGAGPWTASVVTGGQIALDLRDHSHRHIYFFGQTDPEITALICRRFHVGWTMLDVGANAGYHSVLCSDLGARRVVAFEPDPRLHPLLARTAARHPVMRIESAAVGAQAGPAMLQLSADPGNTGLSTLGRNLGKGAMIEVRVVSLDDYCRTNRLAPDLIKISVMGHEQHVTRGMHALLECRIPRIVISELTTRRSDPLAVVSRFAQAGYDAYSIAVDGNLTPFRHSGSRTTVCFAPHE